TAGTSVQPSILFDGDSGMFDNGSDIYWGKDGTPSYLATGAGQGVDPADAATRVFAGFKGGGAAPPPKPTLQQRLRQNRRSVLDGVLGNFNSLRGKVSRADQARLDQHANFIRDLETNLAAGGSIPLQACSPPDPTSLPDGDNSGSQGNKGNI